MAHSLLETLALDFSRRSLPAGRRGALTLLREKAMASVETGAREHTTGHQHDAERDLTPDERIPHPRAACHAHLHS